MYSARTFLSLLFELCCFPSSQSRADEGDIVTVFDFLIRPAAPVTDYRTASTGLSAEDFPEMGLSPNLSACPYQDRTGDGGPWIAETPPTSRWRGQVEGVMFDIEDGELSSPLTERTVIFQQAVTSLRREMISIY